VALGPSAILERGDAVALDDEGRVMARKADFPQQREFTLRLRDGAVRAQVLSAVPDAVDRG
jgi:exonuclease VII large subunit